MSNKLWQGRFNGNVDPVTEQLNRSISFDQRLYPYDIRASIAHAAMLGKQGIISALESEAMVVGLQAILTDLDSGKLAIDLEVEDIHTFVEMELTRRIGEAGKKLHTGRSRNDQVATDLRLYLEVEIQTIEDLLFNLQQALEEKAEQAGDTLMPGYTHLQRAQPVTFGQHLMAYHAMLQRDRERLQDCSRRMMVCPLGAGALAGSSFPLDRNMVAEQLGFHGVMQNTLDAVSDRDHVLEFLGAASIVMMHLSRFCEELVLWCSQEFNFVALDAAYTTGSSMMPQKKNPDLAELIRGKTGRVYGSLLAALTLMKALPLAYNKDMQEDKEGLFDTVDTLKLCLQALASMIKTLTPNAARMTACVKEGYLNATELANYLVKKGVPFRDAYMITGQAVQQAIQQSLPLEALPLSFYTTLSPVFKEDLYTALQYSVATP
ncbi:MAG: argininosuccinate lyase [Vampirovibrio sp.]|jgi:argininosuccinate lyase|nr:argininosuccinate lyase [Vampirovibrio sp.]